MPALLLLLSLSPSTAPSSTAVGTPVSGSGSHAPRSAQEGASPEGGAPAAPESPPPAAPESPAPDSSEPPAPTTTAPPPAPAPRATAAEPAGASQPPPTGASRPRGKDRWAGVSADIAASAFVPAPPEKVFAFLLELSNLRVIFRDDCMGRLELGDRSFGEGASAIVRYDMGLMHRKLAMTLSRAEAPERVQYDHLGDKGFLTTWSLKAEDGGTLLSVSTPINPPPRPLQTYYYTVVQPEWRRCYEQGITNLSRAVVPSAGG